MASFNKVNIFTKDLLNGAHNLGSNTLKVMLTNTAPTSSSAIKSDITDISAGNGYTAGGTATTPTVSTSSGTAKLVCSDVVFTAAGGSIGPFRYVVLYNDTTASPVKPIIGYYDYGSAVTLADTETFTVDFDGSAGVLTVV